MVSSSATTRALHLYRALRRAHQKHLPSREMRDLGNAYVRNEFKLHKNNINNNKNGMQVERFLTEWEQYLQHIWQTAAARQRQQQQTNHEQTNRNNVSFGKDLPHHLELSPEQTVQLEKLRKETESTSSGEGS